MKKYKCKTMEGNEVIVMAEDGICPHCGQLISDHVKEERILRPPRIKDILLEG